MGYESGLSTPAPRPVSADRSELVGNGRIAERQATPVTLLERESARSISGFELQPQKLDSILEDFFENGITW